MLNAKSISLEKVGVTLSLACAVHCLLLPVLLVAMSIGAVEWLADEHTELIILSVAGLIAAVSLWRGCMLHRQLSVWLIFAVAVAIIIGGHTIEISIIRTPLHIAGGVALAATQLINVWLCRRCPKCSQEHDHAH